MHINNTSENVSLQSPPITNGSQERSNDGALTDILIKCLVHWPWFLLSILFFLVVAFFYVKRQEKVYTRSAAVLIKSESSTNTISGSNVSLGADLGLFQGTSEAENEVYAIKSPTIAVEVVKRLKLYMNYQTPSTFHWVTLYGHQLPVEVELLDINETRAAQLQLDLKRDGSLILSHFFARGIEDENNISAKLNETVKTPLGRVRVVPTAHYKAVDLTLSVTRHNIENAIAMFSARLTAQQVTKNSSIIELSYQDVSTERAEDCLNTLIKVYNESWIRDRNQLANSTSQFINERLAIIEQELGVVDSRISDFKSNNLIPDLEAQSGLSLNNADQAEKDAIKLNNQISMLQYVQQYIESSTGQHQLIPANTGIGVLNIEHQIDEYNTKMLRRNNMVANSSESNPLVVDMDADLSASHAAILASIRNQVKLFTSQLNSMQRMQAEAKSNLSSSPKQNLHLLSISRQQGVKEALYLFLLKKREENELSQAFTATNTRIIKEPYGSSRPTAPSTQRIMLIAFVIGLLLPFAVIYLFDLLDKTIRGRKDLDGMRTPFIGEIPEVANRQRGYWTRLVDRYHKLRTRFTGKKFEESAMANLRIDVRKGSRNIINEAFRVVRGNIEFMNTSDSKVFLVTSANPGSGKTYVTLNLGASFAVKDKRVLLIDLDLRKRSLSKFVSDTQKGVSDYLAGHVEDYKSLILHAPLMDNYDILPVGSLPPNPSELLYSPLLSTMLTELRDQYDIIFLDCPPVEIVTDVAIISPLADKAIFVVRAGVFLRSMTSEIDHMYDSQKFGNMSILLNGTEGAGGRYGYSRYGYNYGYNYGYGYSYGSEE